MALEANSVPRRTNFWDMAPGLFDRLQKAGALLAVADTVPQDVVDALDALADAVPETPEAFGAANPYLVGALYAGLAQTQRALRAPDERVRRRDLRIPLERVRQAVRDLLNEEPVMPDRPPKEIARWLVSHEEIPRVELARLLEVKPDTLRRWADPKLSAAPQGDVVQRLSTLARLINQLRWAMTAAGVVAWLKRPHPMLKDVPPESLLSDPGATRTLLDLAGATRSMSMT